MNWWSEYIFKKQTLNGFFFHFLPQCLLGKENDSLINLAPEAWLIQKPLNNHLTQSYYTLANDILQLTVSEYASDMGNGFYSLY